jgi:hypothetical protein
MSTWILILMTTNALTNVPGYKTKPACEAAGKDYLKQFDDGWYRYKFVCLEQPKP